MKIIDQQILIQDVSPETVWQHVSDIAQNPTWQADCRSVAFLSSKRAGLGVRWRYTTADGRECVVETTAWYDGLGYEYTFIDGAPYRASRGRVRLQEVAEGTIVQWTLNYEPGGVLGSVKNTLSLKRHLEANMVDSLKTLGRHIRQTNPGQAIHEPKSLMRDAPDYEARVRYKPRHPSKAEQIAQPVIPEPPISDEDTRPRVVAAKPPPQVPEPMGDLSAFEPPRAPSAENEPWPRPATEPLHGRTTEESRVPPGDTPTHPAIDAVVEQRAVTPADSLLDDAATTDTSQVSVFDVFGLPKPSETQEMKAVSVSESEAVKTTQSAVLQQEAATVELPFQAGARRPGLRLLARRKLVKLRRP